MGTHLVLSRLTYERIWRLATYQDDTETLLQRVDPDQELLPDSGRHPLGRHLRYPNSSNQFNCKLV